MTEDERRNRNPKPETITVKASELRELFIKDLEVHRVYVLRQRGPYASVNYMGTARENGRIVYLFHGPRVSFIAGLRERPDKSGTLEDGAGVKVTIYQYTGPDA